jgi:hypothetical protein
MTIKKLIRQLQKIKNQEAKVLLTIGNEDKDFYVHQILKYSILLIWDI